MSTPIVVAHRGLHERHAENSLAALSAAWDENFEWCECDVRGSVEHVPFLLHDETLDRTTSLRGPIALRPSAQLDSAGVVRLSTVLSILPAHARLLIEIKPNVSAETVARTMQLCDREKCIVQSFHPDILWQAFSSRPDVRLELLVEDAAQPIEPGPWRAINAAFTTLTAKTIGNMRDQDYEIGAWTVNGDTDIERMIELGVHKIITDRPHRARDICGQFG